jgi:hypothetical protein
MRVPLEATLATGSVDIEQLLTQKEALRRKLQDQQNHPPTSKKDILEAEIIDPDAGIDYHSKGPSAWKPSGKCWALIAILGLGVVAAVVVAATFAPEEAPGAESLNEGTTTIMMPSNAPTTTKNAPTPTPTSAVEIILNNCLDFIDDNEFTNNITSFLPSMVGEYEGSRDSPTATPQEKAMSWSLYDDEGGPFVDVADSGTRWAMSSMYFQMGEASWNWP